METPKRLEKLRGLFKIIRRNTFLQKKTTINPFGGISARFTGIGTNENDKRTDLDKNDLVKILPGLQSLKEDVDVVIAEVEQEIAKYPETNDSTVVNG